MPKLIIFSCFVLFWVFYEMSGGSEFAPRERVVVSQAPFGQAASRTNTVDQPTNATQVVTASYQPVETEMLVPVAATMTVQEPAPATVIEMPVVTPDLEPEIVIELRFVAGNRVNLRQGPGTNHQVLDTLARGTEAELIAVNDDGWAQIRLIESGKTGWMAARLLSES